MSAIDPYAQMAKVLWSEPDTYAQPRGPVGKVPELAMPFVQPKRIYLAGPMRGIPAFNFPAFNAAAAKLRTEGHTVFNPAERDIERHGGVDISRGNVAGCHKQAAEEHGFDLRVALGEDLAWICAHADAVALLPGWQKSKGANAECATAHALGLEIICL